MDNQPLLICDHAGKRKCMGCPCSVPHTPTKYTACPGPSSCLDMQRQVYKAVRCVPIKEVK